VPIGGPGACKECRHHRWSHDGVCLQPGCPSQARASQPAPAPKQRSRPKKPGAAAAKANAAIKKLRQEQEYLSNLGLKQKP
jgi:hypothetical protein